MSCYGWSGRGDLNARPTEPKAVVRRFDKRLIFNYLKQKQLARA